MFVRSTTYITPSLPPPTIRFVFGMSSAILDAEVLVGGVQERPVVRREPVEQRAGRTDLEEAVPEVPSADVAVERAVAGQRVEVAGRIRRQSSARLPDAAEPAVRRGVVAPSPAAGVAAS